jgi:hypothetical protein
MMGVDMALVEVSRDRGGYRDRLRAYRVLIDGTEVGRIRAGQRASYEVPAGHHTVELRVDWASSPTLEADLAEAEILKLSCGPSGRAAMALFDLFRPHSWIRLERQSESTT